jgi:hypothetical protein
LRAPLFTLFHINVSRGSDVLLDVLGPELDGLIGCDYFSAYRKFMKHSHVLVQFRLAHLIRDVKFLVEHPAWFKNGSKWVTGLWDGLPRPSIPQWTA